jgi:hypothetical protein
MKSANTDTETSWHEMSITVTLNRPEGKSNTAPLHFLNLNVWHCPLSGVYETFKAQW